MSNNRFIFVSPWLMAASIGLLTLIVVIFAVNNLNREMHLINSGLQERGQALTRFVGAGTRASMLHGMQGAVHTQSLIEQASEDPDILYIAVIDSQGKIMAHSDSSKVGSVVPRDLNELKTLANHRAWHVTDDMSSGKMAFEVVNYFSPFHRNQPALKGNIVGRQEKFPLPKTLRQVVILTEQPDKSGSIGQNNKPSASEEKKIAPVSLLLEPMEGEVKHSLPYDWCRSFVDEKGHENWPGADYKILVGFDMKEQNKISRRAKLHIFSLSVILLLVGLGGWFSLFVAQSYRASQQALKNIQAFADLLVLKLPVGIIATESNGRIKTFNRAIAKMIKISSEEALGAYPSEVLPDVLADYFENIDSSKEVFEDEIEYTPPGYSKINLQVSSVPIIGNKAIFAGRVILVRDFTKLKKLEKEVVKHDRLVALGKMAAGVAHEVRNPLSSIKGFATLLGSNFEEDSEGKKASKLLVNEVERLNRSITELLNYSRPLPLKKKELFIKDIIEDSLRLMSSDAMELGIQINYEVEEDLPSVKADPDRINQVLLNLYLNAFQAMPDGGELTVTARRSNTVNFIEIIVSDNGSGVNCEILGRIVDPYFTTKAEGTGLGLALAHKIIDEHDGSIKFDSIEGNGTSVTVELPIT